MLIIFMVLCVVSQESESRSYNKYKLLAKLVYYCVAVFRFFVSGMGEG